MFLLPDDDWRIGGDFSFYGYLRLDYNNFLCIWESMFYNKKVKNRQPITIIIKVKYKMQKLLFLYYNKLI